TEGELEISLANERPVNNVLVLLVTSDRGLCGGYNSNLIKTAKILIKEKYPAQLAAGKVQILPIGKKGYEHFSKGGYRVIDTYWEMFHGLSFEKVQSAARFAMDEFAEGRVDAVEIVYSEFKNAATQKFVVEQ